MVFLRISMTLVWPRSYLEAIHSRQCLDESVGQILNGIEDGFVEHQLNCVLISCNKRLTANLPYACCHVTKNF